MHPAKYKMPCHISSNHFVAINHKDLTWNQCIYITFLFCQLTKLTTIQATGVASGLVETIQGAGFKLQTLNLSFEDQEEVLLS